MSASSWHVYVLRCADGTLYTGITTDLERRLREHNGLAGGARRGAAYTRARRPVRLGHHEPAADRAAATRRELAIKRLDRRAKERLLAASGANAVDSATAGSLACKAPSRGPPSLA